MMWYLVMTEAFITSAPRMADEVDADVRTGALAVQLIRPVSYPLYRLWLTLGERCVRFSLNLTAGVLVTILLVGLPPLTPVSVVYFLLTLPGAWVLDFLMYFLIGLGAFWLEDTSGLRLLFARTQMILGGMLIPMELFPDWSQPILNALPFASQVYGPARLFVQPDTGLLFSVLLRQGIFVVIVSVLAALLYRNAVRRINANGG